MKQKLIAFSVFGLFVGAGIANAAVPADAKYGGHCAYSLAAKGEAVLTDCKSSWTDPKDKGLYCFGNEEAKKEFAKDVEKHKKLSDEAFLKVSKTNIEPVKVAPKVTDSTTKVAPESKPVEPKSM